MFFRLLIALLFLSATLAEVRAVDRVYIFSNDARFAEIALDEKRIVDVGNLWHMDIFEVREVLRPSNEQSILLRTKGWKLLGIEQPKGFSVYERSCLERSSLRLYTPGSLKPHAIPVLDLNGWTVSLGSYEEVGSPIYVSKFAAATSSEACLMLVGEREVKGGTRTFYLYDYVNEQVLSTFQPRFDADYHLLADLQSIVADRKEYLDGGRLKKLGKVHILDYNGHITHTFDLPQDGKLAAVSQHGEIGIYFSPNMLTILDFKNPAILGEIQIPFQYGHVALLE